MGEKRANTGYQTVLFFSAMFSNGFFSRVGNQHNAICAVSYFLFTHRWVSATLS